MIAAGGEVRGAASGTGARKKELSPVDVYVKQRVLTDVLETDCPGSDLDNNDLCGCIENIVAKGLYAEQLRRWAAVLPRAQLLALDSSELRSPDAVLSKLGSFLGLPLSDIDSSRLGAVNTKAAPINFVAGLDEGNTGEVGWT